MKKYELIERKPVDLLCQHHMPAKVSATRLIKFHDVTLFGKPFSVEVPLCDKHASVVVSLTAEPEPCHDGSMTKTSYQSAMILQSGKIMQNGEPHVMVVPNFKTTTGRCNWGYSLFCKMGNDHVTVESYTPAITLGEVKKRAELTYSIFCADCFDQHRDEILSLSNLQKRTQTPQPEARKKTTHSECTHESSKSARAKCRRERNI